MEMDFRVLGRVLLAADEVSVESIMLDNLSLRYSLLNVSAETDVSRLG
jgi:hypothetical protein